MCKENKSSDGVSRGSTGLRIAQGLTVDLPLFHSVLDQKGKNAIMQGSDWLFIKFC